MVRFVFGVALASSGLTIAQTIPEPYGLLAQYGLAGVLGVLLIRRYEAELAREREARQAAEAQRDTLAERAVADLIPLVVEVQRTMVPTLDRVVEEVRRNGERLDRLERPVGGG